MYHNDLNSALDSVNLSMTMDEVSTIIGSIDYEETKRFQFNGFQVSIYRMPSGKYEILSYRLQ